MKQIMQRKREYAQLPLFTFMKDASIDPAERLGFYPCIAHFILSFGDLNRYVLRVEPTTDKMQEMVNTHSYEDDHHWPWYLEDFVKLGLDQPRSPTEWMKFLWSDRTAVSRMLSSKLAHLIWSAEDAVEKIAIIEAIEETGNILFALTAELAEQITARTGVELRYLGHFHFELESGHAVDADHKAICAIDLDPARRERFSQRVDAVFKLFEEWTQELLAFAQEERKVAEQASLLKAVG